MASSASGSLNLQFIKSKRGKQKLIRAGYQYNLNIKNKNGTSNWRCINREICNGSITISSDNASILGERKHCCTPNFVKNKIDARMDVCKERVQNEFKSIPKIFDECFEDMESSDSDSYKTPHFISKANSLYNARKKAFHISKCRFTSCNEVTIPPILKKNFLLNDISEENDFLIFSSPYFLELCKETDLLMGDGTFQTVPSPFYQLFTFHIDSGSSRVYTSIVPAIFCLLANKQQKTYEKLFRFTSCNEVTIPPILKKNFLLNDISEENDFLIFSSPYFLELCKETDLLMGDGTFQTVPSPFYQLFTFHIDSGSSRVYTSIVPAIFCLLANKQQKTYEKLFRFLKSKLNLTLNFFKCDYEQALINAVQEVFPQVKVSGCYFHFKRAIMRKGKELGMLDDKKLKKYVYLTCNLALIPSNFIPEGWLAINEKLPDCPIAIKFAEYFTNQWVHKITANVWCCAYERHRTTNSLEAWHNRLKLKVEDNENLFLFIKTLKKEAKFYEQKVKTKQNKKRPKEVMIKDHKIEEEINNLMLGKTTVAKCLANLSWL